MEPKNHLMHPRTANNHRNHGYFPTDNATLEAVAARLDIADGGAIRIFDPCCGEGLALAFLAEHLETCGTECQTYGIELDNGRAESASGRLKHVICADIENCTMQASGVGMLFLKYSRTLWPHFGQYFGSTATAVTKRPPLCALGQWHSALALAAGQVSGIVIAADGRKMLVKGSTYKTKVETRSEEYDSKDRLIVTLTSTDRFVPTIRAVNLTAGSPDYGKVLVIK